MHIPDFRWQSIELKQALQLFPGEVGLFLKQTTPSALLNFEKFLPIITWRWYFLHSHATEANPYVRTDVVKMRGQWPPGEFWLFPKLIYKSPTQVEISLDVEYLSLAEQPWIVDVVRTQRGEPPRYSFDPEYTRLLSKLSPQLPVSKDGKISKQHAITILTETVKLLLLEWLRSETHLQAAWEQEAWLDFWQQQLLQADQDEGLDSEQLLEEFVTFTRKRIPNYGITFTELDTLQQQSKKIFDEEEQYKRSLENFLFWLQMNQYLLIPLSCYNRVVAPYFMDRDNFIDDVKRVLKNNQHDAHELYTPFTQLNTTPTGSVWLKKYVAHHQ